jgi:putative DNA primase/helicase
MLLCCENGVIDLRTGKFRRARPEDMLYRSTRIIYDPYATCPRWKQFLIEVFAGDQELIDWIQKAVGYTLTGEIIEQFVFFLIGGGENGKSKFVGVLSALLGDYSISALFSTFKKTREEGINNDIARMAGARLVSSIEIGERSKLNEERIKNLTGGDKIHARFLYHEGFDFIPSAKFWIASNYRPVIEGTDRGIWRRIGLVSFNVCFPPGIKDERLLEKLLAELPGILNWAVAGCLEWQRDGLGIPDQVRYATEQYRADMDVVSRFVNECCEKGDGQSILSEDLYKVYQRWCEESGEEVKKRAEFGEKIKGPKVISKKDTTGENRGKWRWYGLGVPSKMA